MTAPAPRPLAALGARQLEYVARSTATVNLAEGSIRSGKTISSLLRWLTFVANPPRGGELVMVGRTVDSLNRNVFGPLRDADLFGDLSRHITYNAGAATARVLGRTVHVLGANNIKSEAALRGMTVAGAYVDEVTVLQEAFWMQLLGRMSVEGSALFATTNPDTPSHWMRRRYLDHLEDHPDWAVWKFRLEDNPSLSEGTRARYRRLYTGLWYRRFILGEWVAADGAVFPQWDPDRMVVDDAGMPPILRWYGLGIDYGTTNPFAALTLGLGADRRLYVGHEWRHDARASRRSYTDAEYSRAVREWLPTLKVPGTGAPGVRPEAIVLDPSAASFREQLWRDKVTTTPGDNAVSDGIRGLASLMGRDLLRVHADCTGLLTELPGYSWDDKATAKGNDAPVKTADHSIDALRYVVHTLRSRWTREVARDLSTPREAATP